MPNDAPFTIRPATPADIPAVYALIMELAAYEQLRETVISTPEDFYAALFGETPVAECLVADVGEETVGTALFFTNFSTFMGRAGMVLEDIYVQPTRRGKGIGRAILRRLAQIAQERGYRRMEWAVLDWNQPAIDFYLSLDAQPMKEWTVYRLTGEAIARLARE
ncbi:MAG: GNAT family N-acetyltransferase [Candidatus Omnitrophica bacterium]|jgi:GNAT superfamily N-acetyltransferase|nr:GNAT family N-acetyltransferase [Candidatus Omnitrophota bacterium]MDX9753881.1 GNAT family N-acetyltransferase [bacterium]